jgi:SAM-dependent methyltransferase
LGKTTVECSKQTDLVGSYFDRISYSYQRRYGAENPFHNYFFRDRLSAATDGLTFEHKSVLDVGAGTGPLYDELIKHPGVDYYACDISAKMLSQSSIPAARKFVGKVTDSEFPRDRFDYIFLLGVTTYQSPDELDQTLAFISAHLAPFGKAILSFTNRASLDHFFRGALRLAKPMISRGVIAQAFATHAYSQDDVAELIEDHDLYVAKSTYLNQTFSPFNTLLPRSSVSLARWIGSNCPAALLPVCSADFIVFVEHASSRV